MFIQTRELDDPARMEFHPGEPVLEPTSEALAESEAEELSPLARRLLRLSGVEGVALNLDHLTVRRSEGKEWYLLKPSVLGAIMEHYASGDPVVAGPDVVAVTDLLDDRIRPAVEAYGGSLRFHKLEAGILTVELLGGGGSRKESMISNILTHHLPAVREVRWAGSAPPVEVPSAVLEKRDGALQGPEAEAVLRILDEQVNPFVAAHGGHITLIDVMDHVAYLRMEGGCQGCSASAATLQQGVRSLILSEVPDIREIVDVTDHESGMNPFYQ